MGFEKQKLEFRWDLEISKLPDYEISRPAKNQAGRSFSFMGYPMLFGSVGRGRWMICLLSILMSRRRN